MFGRRGPRLQLTGKRFGKLIAVEPCGRDKRQRVLWLCQCDCGNKCQVQSTNLANGHTQSCGCLVGQHSRSTEESIARRNAAIAKWHKTHRAENKIYLRRRALRSHGLTVEQFQELLDKQDNLCAICRIPNRFTLQVDHDHSCCPGTYSCGRCIRGLLCISCNRAIGLFKDNPAMLKQAIAYLENFGAVTTERGIAERRKLQSELHGDMQSAAEMTAPAKIN
jgi:Recombination endonuclease VII